MPDRGPGRRRSRSRSDPPRPSPKVPSSPPRVVLRPPWMPGHTSGSPPRSSPRTSSCGPTTPRPAGRPASPPWSTRRRRGRAGQAARSGVERNAAGAVRGRPPRGRRGYDPGWSLSVDGVDVGPPLLMNGYAAAWVVPSGDSAALSLSYGPQWAAVVGLAVSGVALLVAAGILVTRRRAMAATSTPTCPGRFLRACALNGSPADRCRSGDLRSGAGGGLSLSPRAGCCSAARCSASSASSQQPWVW